MSELDGIRIAAVNDVVSVDNLAYLLRAVVAERNRELLDSFYRYQESPGRNQLPNGL